MKVFRFTNTIMSSRAQGKFGSKLAELGLFIDCLQKREGKLVEGLKDLLSEIPIEFVHSEVISWKEKQALNGAGACEVPNSSNRGARFANILTARLTILRKAPPSSNPCPSSSTTSSDDCPPKKKLRSNKPSKSKKHKSTSQKSSQTSKSKKTPKKLSKKPISAEDVQALYKKLKVNPSTSAGKLKGGGNGSGCVPCQDAVEDDETTTVSTVDISCPQVCSSSSSSESCPPCVPKTCIPCPKFNLPRLIPYAIILFLQFSRLRGRLNLCNSVLQHKFTGQFRKAIEGKLCELGINFKGGILSRFPVLSTGSFAGYGDTGYPLLLHALIDFKQGVATIGQQNVITTRPSPRRIFGRNGQPIFQQPVQTVFGFGNPSDLLTSGYEVTIVAQLSQIPLFAQIRAQDDAAQSNRGRLVEQLLTRLGNRGRRGRRNSRQQQQALLGANADDSLDDSTD